MVGPPNVTLGLRSAAVRVFAVGFCLAASSICLRFHSIRQRLTVNDGHCCRQHCLVYYGFNDEEYSEKCPAIEWDEEDIMGRERILKVVLVVVGLLFCAGVYPLVLMVLR